MGTSTSRRFGCLAWFGDVLEGVDWNGLVGRRVVRSLQGGRGGLVGMGSYGMGSYGMGGDKGARARVCAERERERESVCVCAFLKYGGWRREVV